MSREIGLVELIENILEKHQPHPEGYCNCGFCVCGFLHQAAMLAPEIERLLAEEREKAEIQGAINELALMETERAHRGWFAFSVYEYIDVRMKERKLELSDLTKELAGSSAEEGGDAK